MTRGIADNITATVTKVTADNITFKVSFKFSHIAHYQTAPFPKKGLISVKGDSSAMLLVGRFVHN